MYIYGLNIMSIFYYLITLLKYIEETPTNLLKHSLFDCLNFIVFKIVKIKLQHMIIVTKNEQFYK